MFYNHFKLSNLLCFLLLILPLSCNQSSANEGQIKSGPRLKQMIRYNQLEKPFIKIDYEYNDRSLLIRETRWDSSGAGVFTKEKTYEYEDTMLVKAEFTGPGGLESVTKYYYDDQNRRIREEEMDTDIYFYKEYEYDDNDHIVKEKTFDINFGITTVTYHYNEKGLLDTSASYGPTNELLRKNVWIYEDTLLTELLFLDPNDSITHHWKYQYAPNGKIMTESELMPDGSEHYLRRYAYDENDNLTVEESTKYRFYTRNLFYDDNGKLAEERQFDKLGNITAQLFYE
jgi:hypothetical protein